MKQSIAFVAVLGIALMGIAIGALGVHLFHAHGHHRPQGADHLLGERNVHPGAHAPFIEHLETVLELTPEQRTAVHEILEESHKKAQVMRKELGPRVRAHMEETHHRLLGLLTEEQQEKMDALHRQHRSSAERLFLGHSHLEKPHSPAEHRDDGVRPLDAAVPDTSTPQDTAASLEVSFPTADGGIVHADVYGQGERAVVLAHGGRFTKESWAEQAPALAAAGFRVVAIDFRGRGQSRGGAEWEASGHDQGVELDVLAAVRYLRRSGAQSVSVVGASFGGWATALASVEADPGEIDSIVLLAASGIDAPERMQGRKLFITTRDDFRGEGTLRLPSIRDQFERAGEPKELVILEGDAHAQFVFDTDQGERLMHEILRFLSEP